MIRFFTPYHIAIYFAAFIYVSFASQMLADAISPMSRFFSIIAISLMMPSYAPILLRFERLRFDTTLARHADIFFFRYVYDAAPLRHASDMPVRLRCLTDADSFARLFSPCYRTRFSHFF